MPVTTVHQHMLAAIGNIVHHRLVGIELLTLLVKARIQIKAPSALGLFLLALQTVVFLAVAGGLGLAAVGGGALAFQRRQAQPA